MRIGSTSYFLGSAKLTGDFQTYYVQSKKANVIFCEARLAPAQLKRKDDKPLTRIIIYLLSFVSKRTKKIYYNAS
jgi:hypothetical protein